MRDLVQNYNIKKLSHATPCSMRYSGKQVGVYIAKQLISESKEMTNKIKENTCFTQTASHKNQSYSSTCIIYWQYDDQ